MDTRTTRKALGAVTLTALITALSFAGNVVQGGYNFWNYRYQQRRSELDAVEKYIKDTKQTYHEHLETAKAKAETLINVLNRGDEIRSDMQARTQERADAFNGIRRRQKDYADTYGNYPGATESELERSFEQPFDRWLKERLREKFNELRNKQSFGRYEAFFAFVEAIDGSWVLVKVRGTVPSIAIRLEGKAESPVVAYPIAGQELHVMSVDEFGAWYMLKIKEAGKVGWAASNNLELPSEFLTIGP